MSRFCFNHWSKVWMLVLGSKMKILNWNFIGNLLLDIAKNNFNVVLSYLFIEFFFWYTFLVHLFKKKSLIRAVKKLHFTEIKRPYANLLMINSLGFWHQIQTDTYVSIILLYRNTLVCSTIRKKITCFVIILLKSSHFLTRQKSIM